MNRLQSLRILVVEDEALIAAMLSDALRDFGADVIGPAGNIEDALDLVDRDPDAAVLDVNLNGHYVDPVARLLAERGVPFVLTSGYGPASLEKRFNVPIFDKPYETDEVVAALEKLLGRAEAR